MIPRPFFRLVIASAATVGAVAGTTLAQCPGAEPPADICSGARVLSGSAGTQFVHVNATGATATGEQVCGVPVGHTVWFSLTPNVSGLVTFTTCHPYTPYDTVAEAFVGGEDSCEFITPVVCNDDTASGECANGCSAYGSTLKFNVVAGQRYRFRVGSYNNNAAGCTLCLGVLVSICNGEATPPEAVISSPTPLACVCPGVQTISGSVNDAGSGVASWVIDFAPVATGGWTEVQRGVGNVVGALAGWNTSGLAEGDYYLRLTARDGCGNTSSSIVTAHVNAGLDSLVMRSPVSGAILGGVVVADGTAWDHCAPGTLAMEHSPLGGSFTPFTTASTPWVINDPLGTWNTRAGTPDGNYTVRATALTPCGHRVQATANVTIDNPPPAVAITSPLACTRLNSSLVAVRGTVNDAHLASWSLQYTGGDASGWITIASGTTPVVNGLLATWDARSLRECAYTLRLVASDASVLDNNSALHNRSEVEVSVDIGGGCSQDYNGDGVVNSQDFFDFLTIFFNGCP